MQQNEDEQQRTDDNPHPPRAQPAIEQDRGLDRAEDQQTEQRARNVSATAGQERAPDHDRREVLSPDVVQRLRVSTGELIRELTDVKLL